MTGSTTAGVTVETDANVRIILAGAEISSSGTAAINVINADNVELEIKDGTTNTVKDSAIIQTPILRGLSMLKQI